MEPGHEDREYIEARRHEDGGQQSPQWSPVMKTGNTSRARRGRGGGRASMEPGHEDREYQHGPSHLARPRDASMEPGHEDREYTRSANGPPTVRAASMEPGHEDREYAMNARLPASSAASLNGARS